MSFLSEEQIAAAAEAPGVGPHPQPWPDDPRLDPALLREGDHRNVVDRYRYWSLAAIVADLDQPRHALHVAIQNWEHDFNIGSMVRTANAFNVGGVHIIGRRRWNRRGAMVTDRYLTVHHHATVAEFADWLRAEAYAAVGVDNLDGAVPLETTELPERVCLVFGSEGPGLTDELVAVCQHWWPSPSTVRPARSMPARPRRSPCITGRSAGPGERDGEPLSARGFHAHTGIHWSSGRHRRPGKEID